MIQFTMFHLLQGTNFPHVLVALKLEYVLQLIIGRVSSFLVVHIIAGI